MNWQIVLYMEPLLYTSPNISKMLVCESLFLIVVVRALSLSLSACRMTGREFFTRFPALYPFLLNQLEEAAATVER